VSHVADTLKTAEQIYRLATNPIRSLYLDTGYEKKKFLKQVYRNHNTLNALGGKEWC
jgi:hypothetical protein